MKIKKCLLPMIAGCLLVACNNQKSNTVTVQFHSQYGGDPGKQTVNIGGYIVEPNLKEDSNKYLVGWYRDSKFTQRFDFSDPITENLNLYARWGGAIEFDYTYHSGGTNDTIKFAMSTAVVSLTATNTMTITWGDGSEPTVYEEDEILADAELVEKHTYKNEGTYRISIDYPLMGFTFCDVDDELLADGNAYVNDFTINFPHPYSTEHGVGYGSMALNLGGKTSAGDISELSRVSASRNLRCFSSDEVFKNTKIESFYFSDGMSEMPENLFSEQSSVKKIGFAKNSTIHTISKRAFYQTEITRVNIPASVHAIESEAFYTKTLRIVRFNSIVPPTDIALDAFNLNIVKQVIVPKGSLKLYKLALDGTELERIIPLLKEAE